MTLPPSSPDEMPAQPKSISLTPDLKDALGLVDCKPGDVYTVELQAKDGSDGDAQSFDVLSSVPGDSDSDAPGMEGGDEEPAPGDEPPGDEPPTDDAGPSLDSILGYKRKPKSSREGLPDTKKMRDSI